MKKLVSFFAIVMLMMVAAAPAKADDCSSAVNKICKAFDYMTAQVNRVTSLEGLDNLDFDAGFNKAEIYSIPDECADYVLTSADKTKLRKSFNGFCNAMVDKMYGIGGGVISRNDLAAQFSPWKDFFNQVLNNSKTLGDMIEGLASLYN